MNKIALLVTLAFLSVSSFGDDSYAVAYLVNLKGDMTIVRGDVKLSASTVCTDLLDGDKLVPETGSSAMIFYTDRVINLSYPQSHIVVKPVKKKPVKRPEKPEILVRAGGVEKPTSDVEKLNLLISPQCLRVEPVSVVRKKGKIYLLSPAVKAFGLTPDIRIKNSENRSVEISLYHFCGLEYALVGTVAISGELLNWNQTEFAPLDYGNSYQLRLVYKDKDGVRKIDSHNFSTLRKEQIKSFNQGLADLRKVDVTEGYRLLRKANQLLSYDCYGDAHSIVEQLLIKEPQNRLLQRLAEKTLSYLEKSSN